MEQNYLLRLYYLVPTILLVQGTNNQMYYTPSEAIVVTVRTTLRNFSSNSEQALIVSIRKSL